MPETAAQIQHEFNGFRLDPQQRLLLAGADGRPIPLAPKVFETLLYFVERCGELLDKTTLMKAIWPNIVVEDGGLTEAFGLANLSLDQFVQSGTIGTAWAFLWMPELLPFRQDPRFQALASRMNLFEYWNKYGPPDNCELRDGKLICN